MALQPCCRYCLQQLSCNRHEAVGACVVGSCIFAEGLDHHCFRA